MEHADRPYFMAEDGVGDLTLWRRNRTNPDYPEALIRWCDLPPKHRTELWAALMLAYEVMP